MLEANFPRVNPAIKATKEAIIAQKQTKFAFLMELSASARDEASYGYAERARDVLPDILGSEFEDEKKRDEYGTRYDRWIWYNMGLAYQHSRLHNKAVSEFNRVISKFWKWVSLNGHKSSNDLSRRILEHIFVVLPSILQRASISLQLQLGYHALQTLKIMEDEINKISEWITALNAKPSSLMKDIMDNLLKQKDIFQLEALLQLERFNDAHTRDAFNTKMQCLWETILGEMWSQKQTELPTFSGGTSERLGTKVRLIEQTVAWFLEKAKELEGELRERLNYYEKNKVCKKADFYKIFSGLEELNQQIKTVSNKYWSWVEDNFFDEQIYFSRWGKFLGISVNILNVLMDLKIYVSEFEKRTIDLLDTILSFYSSKSMWIPVPRCLRPQHRSSLHLENFTYDDIPDLVNGLKAFYEMVEKILIDKNNNIAEMHECIKGHVNSRGTVDPIEYFRDVHLRLLDALDEYEREFSEDRQITFLDRCNERVRWLGKDKVSKTACQNCLSQDNLSSGIPWFATTDPPHQQDGRLSSGAFGELLQCEAVCPKDSQPDKDKPNDGNYEVIMRNAECDFKRHFKDTSAHHPKNPALHFLGLQRWNSLTPAQGKSVGGGYFIYRTNEDGKIDLGIAIDPGFDFVRNFLRMGFSLMDIDIVIISHAHADHVWDFESIVQLLNEMSSKTSQTHRVDVILTLGVYSRFKHIINSTTLRKVINPLVIDIKKEIDSNFVEPPFEFLRLNSEKKTSRWGAVLPGINDKNKNDVSGLKIKATRAYHDDHSNESDSFGFLLTFNQDNSCSNNKEICFGYTGDTKWVGNDLYSEGCPLRTQKEDRRSYLPMCIMCNNAAFKTVAAQYQNCDVILTHIGSLIQHKEKKGKLGKKFGYYKEPDKCEELIRQENHPYLFGMIRLLKELRYPNPTPNNGEPKDKLILLGEFGEELRGGIRDDIVRRFERGILGGWPILPVDVGLDILLNKERKSDSQNGLQHTFFCAMCEQYQPISEVKYHRFGHDEAIFYFCETCLKSTPENVRNAKLQHIYDVGWELKHSI